MSGNHFLTKRRTRSGSGKVVLASHSALLAGGEIAMARTAAALTRYQPHVLLGEDGPIAEQLRGDGVTVEILELPDDLRTVQRGRWLSEVSSSSARSARSYVLGCAHRITELDPVLVHTNSLKAGFLFGAAARMARTPVVWHLRDRLSTQYLPRPAVLAAKSTIRAISSVAIANSASTRATLPAGVPSCVISSPIAAPLPSGPPRPLRSDDVLTFTVLGRLAPWKGQDLFLQAFARAFPTDNHRALVVGGPLFGETAFEAHLEREVHRLGLADRVELTGHVPDPAVHLDRTDVLVHSSIIPEPFGLVIVEGMASGLSVVAADQGGPAETITHNVDGLLYPMGNVDALADQLRKLARGPDTRARLGVRARDASQRYQPARIAERVERVYDCVASARGARARHLVINGRFQTRPVSGVERFAWSISSQLETPTTVRTPPTPVLGRGLAGHVWEQLVLPLSVPRGAVLWNPCNFGPGIARRQIVTVHDVAPLDHPEWFNPRYRAWFNALIPRLCRRSLAVTTVSSFTKGRLVDRFGIDSDSIHVIPNGCNFRQARSLSASEPSDRGNEYVLAVGSVDPRKNIAGIQAAVSTVRGAHPNLGLKIVGGAPTRVFAPNASRVETRDTVVGYVSYDELLMLYRNARCLVYASFYEGFGLPPLEAMALGTRVVTSRLPSIEECCGTAAIYVDPHDHADIARGIERALTETEEEREAAIREGVRRASEFTWARAAHGLDDLVHDLLLGNASQQEDVQFESSGGGGTGA
jgi:glycosyltransferase involved in cell wall biosynthesis